MGWQPPRPPDELDVVETAGFGRRSLPRWVRTGLVVALGVGLVTMLVLRSRAEAFTVDLGRPYVADNTTVAVDLTVRNHLDANLEVLIRPAALDGFAEAGLGDPLAPLEAPSRAIVPGRGELRISVSWTVSDCVAAGSGSPAVPYVDVGAVDGGAFARSVATKALLPPVCDRLPDRGRPVQVSLTPQPTPRLVKVFVGIENIGGRALQFDDVSVAGDRAFRVTNPEPKGRIAVGDSEQVVVAFPRTGCSSGLAVMQVHFTTEATPARETLWVRIDDSWDDLLC